MRTRKRIDANPDEHSFMDALATVSFKLACGCYVPHGDPSEAVFLKSVGATYPCNKHGEVIITKATQRLCDWKVPEWAR